MFCRRQGMLTQEPTPDPKCKVIILSSLTLPHLLNYLICTRNAMSIVLLLQMMEGGWFILGCGWEDRGWVLSYSFCFFSCAFVFCCLTFSDPLFRWLQDDRCCAWFFVFSLFSLSLVSLTRSYILVQRNCCICCVKLF